MVCLLKCILVGALLCFVWVDAYYFSLFALSGTDVAVSAAPREFLTARVGIQHMQQLNRRFDHGYVESQLSIDFVVFGR